MFPDDRVLIGVVNRKRDLEILRRERWYRIPQQKMPHGVYTEYLGFFLSRSFQDLNGAVHYYARRRGVELVYRKDLLPKETNHKRANEVYYKVQLGELTGKVPPITNTSKRTISFIYTTWDRFIHAQTIKDLYSQNDYFVDRIYHALRDTGVRSNRFWEAERKQTGHGAQLRILCEEGEFVASPDKQDGTFFLDTEAETDELLQALKTEIAKMGGPLTIRIPYEGQ